MNAHCSIQDACARFWWLAIFRIWTNEAWAVRARAMRRCHRSWSFWWTRQLSGSWSAWVRVSTTCALSLQILTLLPCRMANRRALMAARISALLLVCRHPGTTPCAIGHHVSVSEGSAAMRLHPATLVYGHVGRMQEPSTNKSRGWNGGISNDSIRSGCLCSMFPRSRTDWGKPIQPW